MLKAVMPPSIVAEARESARLDALRSLHVWDVLAAPEIDRITSLVAGAFNVPTVLVSLVGKDRQRFLSRVGIDESETELEASICAVAIEQKRVFVVENLVDDQRFATNRLVASGPGFRFYAGAPLVTPSGHAVGTLCLLDQTPRTFSEAERRQLAAFAALVLDQIALREMVGRRDPVTGLLNRQQFYADIGAMSEQGFEGERYLVLIDAIDLPTTHRLAQALGLSTVESIIRQVALRLQDVVRTHAELYHVGTARFAFIVPQMPADGARELRRAVAAAVETPLLAEGIPLNPDCHAGIVAFNRGDAPDALRKAMTATQDAIDDHAVWRTYDGDRDARTRRQYRLAADVSDGLARGEFRLLYQPRVDLASQRVVGAEALLRWRHPEFGDVSPGEFIPIVARTSNMSALTDWVTAAACRQLAAWTQAGIAVSLSINVAASDFSDGLLLDRVLVQCERHGVDPTMLELEITEGEWLESKSWVLSQLRDMKAAGVRVAIDDFGVGYSNFSYLFTIPVDALKIDQGLVRGFLHNPRQFAMLRGIVRLCKQIGLDVVAEGVETEAELIGLLKLGCAVGQGYFLSRPLNAEAFAVFVAQRGISPG